MIRLGLKDTVELIGIAAIVASLVFVGMQIRQEQEIAIVATYGELSQSQIELTFKIGEQMNLWKKGLDGAELSAEELDGFAVMAASVTEFHQRMFIRWTRLGPVNQNAAASRFAFALYVFPGLRQHWEFVTEYEVVADSAGGVVESSLNAWERAVKTFLAKFDEEKPRVPTRKHYVFWDT